DGFRPLLVTNLLHKTSVREKRSEDLCDPNTSCCRLPLEVNFTRMGYHSIFRPVVVNIGYCYGRCEGQTGFGANHTLFKHYVRQDSQTSQVLQNKLTSCCVPTKLTQIDLLRTVNGHQHKHPRSLYTWTSPGRKTQNEIDYQAHGIRGSR
ncbi:hypothetical protein EGW08_009461, partial [Elysia chlorotica]